MKVVDRRIIAGLLCLCGAFGCAQLPSRGLFAKRLKPSTAESRADERSGDIDENSADFLTNASWDRSHSSDSQSDLDTVPQLDPDRREAGARLKQGPSLAADSKDDPVEVSNRNPSGTATSRVEAPPLSRRPPAVPGAFLVPPDAREIPASTTPTQGSNFADQGSVVLANHEVDPRSNSSNIEVTGGQRRADTSAAATSNPWDQFRGLTNRPDYRVPRTNGPVDLRMEGRGDQTLGQPIANQQRLNGIPPTDQSPGSISGGLGNTASPAWGVAASQSEANSVGSLSSRPEPWPRATENWNTASFAPVNSAFPHMPQTHAEQHDLNSFPGSAAFNPHSQGSPATPQFNFGTPLGAPLAIAPFASSPELERLITQTTVEAAAIIPGDTPASRQLFLRKHVQLRLLHLISGQTDRALQPIPGVDSVDQEFWQQMMWGLANYFDTQGMPDGAERATQTISQLRIAATKLQEKARLELHNVAFCHKISGFGNYQRFKRDEFTPGQPVLLYAEVADFKSEPTPDGQFRTLMKSTLEVLEVGPTGRLVETLPLSPSEDRCRNQRRDYYHSYEFTIPQSCNAGPHTLQLRVEDQLGKKSSVTKLNFTVQ